jgi:hypothetical protein
MAGYVPLSKDGVRARSNGDLACSSDAQSRLTMLSDSEVTRKRYSLEVSPGKWYTTWSVE